MKIKFGALVVEGRGKIGGQVASRNRAGSYLRNKVSPVNPNTSAQNNARSFLTTLSQAWRGLTAAQRSSWNNAVGDFAKTDVFGDLKNPSGFNLYQRLNLNLLHIGEATIDVAPLPSEVLTAGIGALSIDIGAGDAYTIATDAAVPTATSMEVWATPSLSPGKNFVKSELRLLEVFDAAAASPHDIKASYEARFGVATAGSKVFVQIKFVNQATGQASTTQQASTIVADT